MDKTIEQIFKTFNHIARELQIYFIPGFIVLLNLSLINYYYNGNSYIQFWQQNYIFIVIIASYVSGHIVMAFYYALFEITKIEGVLNNWLGLNYTVVSKLLPEIYKADKEAYFHFIERYSMLTLMRTGMFASFFIIYLINVICLYIKPFVIQVWGVASISLVFSVIMFVLTSKTEKDYANRINYMWDAVQSKEAEEHKSKQTQAKQSTSLDPV